LDPLIKSQLLYQLSYAPGSTGGRHRQAGVALAKATRAVQLGARSKWRKTKEKAAGTSPAAWTAGRVASGSRVVDRRPLLVQPVIADRAHQPAHAGRRRADHGDAANHRGRVRRGGHASRDDRVRTADRRGAPAP
jgi:hypothetical protein